MSSALSYPEYARADLNQRITGIAQQLRELADEVGRETRPTGGLLKHPVDGGTIALHQATTVQNKIFNVLPNLNLAGMMSAAAEADKAPYVDLAAANDPATVLEAAAGEVPEELGEFADWLRDRAATLRAGTE